MVNLCCNPSVFVLFYPCYSKFTHQKTWTNPTMAATASVWDVLGPNTHTGKWCCCRKPWTTLFDLDKRDHDHRLSWWLEWPYSQQLNMVCRQHVANMLLFSRCVAVFGRYPPKLTTSSRFQHWNLTNGVPTLLKLSFFCSTRVTTHIAHMPPCPPSTNL